MYKATGASRLLSVCDWFAGSVWLLLQLARRERFKREFLAYKAARDQQIEERARANAAATRIQSWWRMTMVRKGLGPYKRIPKKKKKKKK